MTVVRWLYLQKPVSFVGVSVTARFFCPIGRRCLQGPVLSVAADPTGRHMVTTGADGQVKVWDLRTYQPLHAYFSPSPATCCDISQRGMLAVGWGRRINIWKDALTSKQRSPYMTHTLQAGQLRDFHFCPYEVSRHLVDASSLLVCFRMHSYHCACSTFLACCCHTECFPEAVILSLSTSYGHNGLMPRDGRFQWENLQP